ncbi:MAG: 50S ribosomal protein L17 [Bacteroidales bacterium]|nr:50S ribosomal protein L17 [Bacteroidales bacterium]
MRHRKSFNHLGRKPAHRKAMLSNMASSLILHKRINTTIAKAKALKVYVEPLITKSKDDSTHSRRVIFRYLQNKEAVTELFREVSSKIADRPGGYTRILKTGHRLGDNADMCIIELVDYNENLLAAKSETKAKSTRRRRGAKKTTDQVTEQVEVAEEEVKTEEVKTEEVEAIEEVEVKDEVAEAPVVVEEKAEEVKETAKKEAKEKKTEKPVEAKKEVKKPKETPKKEAKKEEDTSKEKKEEE